MLLHVYYLYLPCSILYAQRTKCVCVSVFLLIHLHTVAVSSDITANKCSLNSKRIYMISQYWINILSKCLVFAFTATGSMVLDFLFFFFFLILIRETQFYAMLKTLEIAIQNCIQNIKSVVKVVHWVDVFCTLARLHSIFLNYFTNIYLLCFILAHLNIKAWI